jgi:hypothetical protein
MNGITEFYNCFLKALILVRSVEVFWEWCNAEMRSNWLAEWTGLTRVVVWVCMFQHWDPSHSRGITETHTDIHTHTPAPCHQMKTCLCWIPLPLFLSLSLHEGTPSFITQKRSPHNYLSLPCSFHLSFFSPPPPSISLRALSFIPELHVSFLVVKSCLSSQ